MAKSKPSTGKPTCRRDVSTVTPIVGHRLLKPCSRGSSHREASVGAAHRDRAIRPVVRQALRADGDQGQRLGNVRQIIRTLRRQRKRPRRADEELDTETRSNATIP
jgi:hypothetical protein